MSDSHEKYYSLLLDNKTDEDITLYIYPTCESKLSLNSKIIHSGRKYLERNTSKFGYDIFIKRKRLSEFKVIEDDIYIEITTHHGVREDHPRYHQNRWQISVQHHNFKKSLSPEGKNMDLYATLGLNMKDVRKLKREDQTQKIKSAFRSCILMYHPDRGLDTSNEEICMDVLLAYEILRDVNKRLEYHNMVDYNSWGHWNNIKKCITCYFALYKKESILKRIGIGIGGVIALPVLILPAIAGFTGAVLIPAVKDRLKSIFLPELPEGKSRIKHFFKRLFYIGASLAAFAGGIALVATTAGLALPFIIAGSIFGFGFIGAGALGLSRSLQINCKAIPFFKTILIGFCGGCLTGAIAAGAVLIIGGAGIAVSSLSIGQQALIGAIAGTSSGVFTSLSADAVRALVDKEPVTLLEVIVHAICGAVIGGMVGGVGGAAAGKVGGIANTFGDEQIAISGLRRVGINVGKKCVKTIAESSVKNSLCTVVQIVEERLDVNVENREFSEYLRGFAINSATDVVQAAGGETVSGIYNEGVQRTKANSAIKTYNKITQSSLDENEVLVKAKRNKHLTKYQRRQPDSLFHEHLKTGNTKELMEHALLASEHESQQVRNVQPSSNPKLSKSKKKNIL